MTAERPSPGTYRQYRAIIDALPNTLTGQVIAGRLVVMPRPAPPHIHAASALDKRIGSLFQDGDGGPGGWWILPEPELALGVDADFDPVSPDLAGWRRERMPQLPTTASFALAPDWVCEVLSPSTKAHDRDDKLPFYARAGVAHAWLVDPAARTLEAFVREGEGYRALGVWRGEARVRVEPFEAAELDLARLWIA